MKRFICSLLALVLCLSMVSCEKLEGDSSDYSSKIIGTWRPYKLWEEGWGTTIWDDEEDGEIFIQFQKSGKGKLHESFEDEVYEESFTWEIMDDVLIVNVGYYIDAINILKLTNKVMNLEYNNPEDDEHWIGYFKKVK